MREFARAPRVVQKLPQQSKDMPTLLVTGISLKYAYSSLYTTIP